MPPTPPTHTLNWDVRNLIWVWVNGYLQFSCSRQRSNWWTRLYYLGLLPQSVIETQLKRANFKIGSWVAHITENLGMASSMGSLIPISPFGFSLWDPRMARWQQAVPGFQSSEPWRFGPDCRAWLSLTWIESCAHPHTDSWDHKYGTAVIGQAWVKSPPLELILEPTFPQTHEPRMRFARGKWESCH